MSFPSESNFFVASIGGSEIIVILVLLLIFAAMALGLVGLVYVIVRAVVNRPPPALANQSPEAVAQQQRRDAEHVKLLAIFHFVFGGLALAGVGFLCIHYTILHTVFSNPGMWKNQRDAMPPKAFLDVFIWFYLFMGGIFLTGLALNVLSGLFLLRKRNRLFSLVVAGLNCLQIPFGTALGVFTIVVLSRDGVRQLYSEKGSPTP